MNFCNSGHHCNSTVTVSIDGHCTSIVTVSIDKKMHFFLNQLFSKKIIYKFQKFYVFVNGNKLMYGREDGIWKLSLKFSIVP